MRVICIPAAFAAGQLVSICAGSQSGYQTPELRAKNGGAPGIAGLGLANLRPAELISPVEDPAAFYCSGSGHPHRHPAGRLKPRRWVKWACHSGGYTRRLPGTCPAAMSQDAGLGNIDFVLGRKSTPNYHPAPADS